MITARELIVGILLPGAVTALIILLAAPLPRIFRAAAGPLALGAGFVVAYAALLGLPPLRPLESYQWLFGVAAVMSVVAGIDAWLNPGDRPVAWWVWAARAVVVAIVSTWVMWQITRPLTVYQWTVPQAWVWIGVISSATVALWMAVDLLAARVTDVSPLVMLALVINLSAATIGMSGTAKLAQIAGMLAAVTSAAAVVGIVISPLLWRRAIVMPVIVLFVPLVVSATQPYYAQLKVRDAVLLLGAGTLAWAVELIPLRRRPLKIAVRLILPLIPALIAAVLAALEFRRQSAQMLDYSV